MWKLYLQMCIRDRFRDTVACVEREGADYGCNDTLKGQKIMVEFVSANPIRS